MAEKLKEFFNAEIPAGQTANVVTTPDDKINYVKNIWVRGQGTDKTVDIEVGGNTVYSQVSVVTDETVKFENEGLIVPAGSAVSLKNNALECPCDAELVTGWANQNQTDTAPRPVYRLGKRVGGISVRQSDEVSILCASVDNNNTHRETNSSTLKIYTENGQRTVAAAEAGDRDDIAWLAYVDENRRLKLSAMTRNSAGYSLQVSGSTHTEVAIAQFLNDPGRILIGGSSTDSSSTIAIVENNAIVERGSITRLHTPDMFNLARGNIGLCGMYNSRGYFYEFSSTSISPLISKTLLMHMIDMRGVGLPDGTVIIIYREGDGETPVPKILSYDREGDIVSAPTALAETPVLNPRVFLKKDGNILAVGWDPDANILRGWVLSPQIEILETYSSLYDAKNKTGFDYVYDPNRDNLFVHYVDTRESPHAQHHLARVEITSPVNVKVDGVEVDI